MITKCSTTQKLGFLRDRPKLICFAVEKWWFVEKFKRGKKKGHPLPECPLNLLFKN